MENKETMNLQQKLIAISNEMPKLLKKHYSDEVDYDFVKIDDIFELLNPAFTKHHICLQELEETDAAYSKVDGFIQQNLHFLLSMRTVWRKKSE